MATGYLQTIAVIPSLKLTVCPPENWRLEGGISFWDDLCSRHHELLQFYFRTDSCGLQNLRKKSYLHGFHEAIMNIVILNQFAFTKTVRNVCLQHWHLSCHVLLERNVGSLSPMVETGFFVGGWSKLATFLTFHGRPESTLRSSRCSLVGISTIQDPPTIHQQQLLVSKPQHFPPCATYRALRQWISRQGWKERAEGNVVSTWRYYMLMHTRHPWHWYV